MQQDFRISAIIATYNYGRFVQEAIESALRQTVPPHEVIVVDDGSTDNTPAVVAPYCDRITYIQQENRGVSAARNAGIERATGNWLAFLDADDQWEPEYLESLRSVCGDAETVLIFTDFRSTGVEERYYRASQGFEHWDPERELLVPLFSVMPSCTIVRNGLPVRFPEWAGNNEDAIYFNDVSVLGRVRCVKEPLMRYRRHSASAQATTGAKPTGCENLLRWAREREPSRPGIVHRLFRTLAKLVLAARWKRNWPQYWMIRNFCEAHWPDDMSRPPVLSERVWPQLVYNLKDRLDVLRSSFSRVKE